MDKLREAAWTAIHKISRSTGFDEESDDLLMEAATVLRKALRPEVAPDGRVAKTVFTLDDMTKAFEEGRKNGITEALAGVNMLQTEQAEQEPIGYIDAADFRELCNGNERQYSLFTEDKGRMVAIYAAPVRTKDLTDDEIEALAEKFVGQQSIALCRAVIAADRRKNK